MDLLFNFNTTDKIMKLEVFAYYPYPEPKITKKGAETLGSLHLFIADYSMDIRFILVTKTPKGRYICYFPHKLVKDGENYFKTPIVDFVDVKTKKKIITFCEKYIKNYYTPKEES